MRYSNQGRFRQQVSFLRRQYLQDGDLPFSNVLSEQIVAQALTAIHAFWMDRIYSPLVTLWVFLGQVLSADHSCRAAVARLVAHRISRGQPPCSSETGAYCQARKRMPEEFFSEVARQTGRALEASVDPQWLWKGRRVHIFDGSSVSMPDTPENQRTIHNLTRRNPAWVFPWHALRRSFLLLAVQFWTWQSVATQARDKANSRCFAACGACFAQATSCSPIASCVLGWTWSCSRTVVSIR